MTGITVTTALPLLSSNAAFTLGCLPSLIRLRVVGNGNLNRPLSPPASASLGDSQIESVDSLPSWAPTCSGGAAARKNQVSKRFGTPAGVIQCAYGISSSSASTMPLSVSTLRNVVLPSQSSARCAASILPAVFASTSAVDPLG